MTSPVAGVLLDRDGTIIVERDYLSDPRQVVLEEGAAKGLRRLAETGMPLVVVSNQSGVGRGYFDRDAVDAVNRRVAELLADEGVSVAGWYYCPHAPEDGCACRKPGTGMALDAARDLGLDLGRSWVIGDKRSDLEMGDRIGARGILLLTGHGATDRAWATAEGRAVCATLDDAATLILGASLADGDHAMSARGI